MGNWAGRFETLVPSGSVCRQPFMAPMSLPARRPGFLSLWQGFWDRGCIARPGSYEGLGSLRTRARSSICTASRSNIIPCENCRAFARLTLINDYPFTKGFMEATYECSVCGSVMKRATQAKDRVGNDQVPVGYMPCTKLPGGNVASRGDNLLRRAGDRIATMALTARYLRVCLADRSIKSLF